MNKIDIVRALDTLKWQILLEEKSLKTFVSDDRRELAWNKGFHRFGIDAMCLIRTSVGTPDGSYIYYVETRKSIGDYEEFIPISELEKLPKEE